MASFSRSLIQTLNEREKFNKIFSFFLRLMEIKIEHFDDIFCFCIHSTKALLVPILNGF